MESVLDINILSTFGEEAIKTFVLVGLAIWVLRKQKKEKRSFL